MRFFSMGILWALLSHAAWSDTLSLDEALKQALHSHPQIKAARHRLEGARLRARYSGAPLNPVLRLGETAGDPVEEVNSLTQRLELAGQPGLRSQVAEAELRFRQAELGQAERDLALQIGRFYISYWLSQQRLHVFEQRQQLYQRLDTVSRRRYEVGEIARNQYTRVALETQRAAADLAGAQGETAQAEARLRTALALEGSVQITEVLQAPTPVATLPASLPEAVGFADRQPEVLGAEAAWQAAGFQTHLARKQGAPELGLSLYRSSFTRATVAQGFQVTLSWTPWDYGQIEADVVARQGEQDALQAEIENAKRNARQRLETTYQAWSAARQRRDLLRDQMQRSLELAETAQKGFASGYWTLQDALDSQRAYRDAQLEFLSAENDQALNALELAWLCRSEGKQ